MRYRLMIAYMVQKSGIIYKKGHLSIKVLFKKQEQKLVKLQIIGANQPTTGKA